MSTSAFAPTAAPLRRFVTDGLRATLDAYAAGTLPLHRLTWELDARLATLAELTALPHHRTLATLRDALRAVATIDAALRATVRADLTPAEDRAVAGALTALRTGLARLDPPDPVDPVAPVAARPVVVPITARRHLAAVPTPGGDYSAA